MAAVTASADPISERRRVLADRALVRGWLYVVLLVLFALVLVGGATRLTDSGLSITEWKPIHGVVPPLSNAEWQEEFDKYRQIAEYQQVNKGMSLEAFKTIFWWEWAHRLLARMVGVVFALPLLVLWLTGRIERGLAAKLAAILALGGLQGAVGWWMVRSGLTGDAVDVSAVRLAVHLTLAAVIFTATMLVARGLAPHSEAPADARTTRQAGVLVLLVLLQILLGALVAGSKAGLTFNTWPLLDGAVFPSDMLVMQPWWENFVANPKTVQFLHRTGAYILLAAALWHMIAARRAVPATLHARRALILFHLVLVQAIVGIATLLMQVPLHAALTHQGFALVVLGFAAAHWRGTKGPYPIEGAARA